MKGVVFTEFMEMVDTSFGPHITETIISQSDLPSGGAYTSVGTYPHSEIVTLVTKLAETTNTEVPVLVKTFGTYLLGRFTEMYPAFFEGQDDVCAFLEGVDGYIHGEVRKLYPDATLPKITTERLEGGDMLLNYKSERMMGDLAEGLIAGALAHFGDTHTCERQDLPQEGGSQCVMFKLVPRRPH